MDTKSLLNPPYSGFDDDLITHSTKKRINIPSMKDESENMINIGNIEKKKKKGTGVEKIEVSLPSKERKGVSIRNVKVLK